MPPMPTSSTSSTSTSTSSPSNVLDTPAKKIKDLITQSKVQYDPTFSTKSYVRSAQAILNTADIARVKGQMETAFVAYLKATSIMLEIVPQRKDFDKSKTDPEYISIMKGIPKVFKDTELIKELLTAKYESVQQVDAAALAAAAKPGRAAPPPKPSKPEFLQVSSGTTPTAASTTTTTTTNTNWTSTPMSMPVSQPVSSFSAPATPSMGYLSSVPTSFSMSSNPGTVPSVQGPMTALSMSPSTNNQSDLLPPPSSLPSFRPLQPTVYGAATPPITPQLLSQPASMQSTMGGWNGTSFTGNNVGPMQPCLPTSSPSPSSSSSSQFSSEQQYIPTTSAPASYSTTSHLTADSNRSNNNSPVPAPRPARSLLPPPPTTAPVTVSSAPTTSNSSSSQPAPTTNNKDDYPYPVEIKPQRLLDYFKQTNGPPNLLLLDVRRQIQYKSAKIKYPKTVNVDPLAIRDGVSAKQIEEQGLFNNPPHEHELFSARSKNDLVIYYDQNSTVANTKELVNLYRALHSLEFEKVLQRRPVFLVGGFDAWLECAGMNWVEGDDVDKAKRLPTSMDSPASSTSSLTGSSDPTNRPASAPIPQSHQSQNYAFLNKIALGGGINRAEGRKIMRNVQELVDGGDGPQSMVNPKLGTGGFSGTNNKAYPPQATPYSNSNASSYPPELIAAYASSMPVSNGVGSGSGTAAYGSYPPDFSSSQAGLMSNGSASQSINLDGYSDAGKLQRRTTVYDNHWMDFGASEKPFSPTMTSPPIPDKVPLPGTAMGSVSALTAPDGSMNLVSGPAYNYNAMSPTSTAMTNSSYRTRPDIPAKPMRPLPQPPGMNDLRDYTKFGSGFSQMGGSQLGKTGLTNLGNTCYMNSVIQCLIATSPLSRFFMDGSFKRFINIRNSLGTQGRLADAFADLIRSMRSGMSLVISPTSFRYAIAGFAPQFKGTEQHDSQEFLSFLLDGLHEDLKLEPRPAITAAGEPPEGSDADEARMEALPEYDASEIAWQRYLRRENSIIVSLFQGQFKNRLTCSKCGKTSTTYNAFMYLALPIKAKTLTRQAQTLQSCLNNFVEPELMEGENAWHCPHCKKPRKATKQMTLSRLPDVLLIQLKRFSSEGPFKNKIKAMVQYPIQDLDLTKYMPSTRHGKAEPAIYDLYAVSNHSGEVSSGHYTACVRGEVPGSWTNFDDTRVSPCDKSVAVSEHGYTLFYVRKK
ncbi:ubiquitin-specific protease doa4 [Gryganskiella cystojenkinii]|nr:ubiquitin-specific protease doa4 [Gryganskiella cystojenkinii]